VTVLFSVLGGLLILVALADAVMTTMMAGAGGGPLTRWVSRRLWRGLLTLVPLPRGRKLLTFGGPLVLLTTVLVWVLLLWAGWGLFFLAPESAVLDSTARTSAGGAERFYFAGFTVFTLGLGDYVPSGAFWQMAAAFASFTGLFLVTLSITYLLSVVTAVVSGRRFAASLHLYGGSGAEVVLLHSSDGSLTEKLSTRLQSLAEEVVASAQQHLAYPVLHFFHASDDRSSTPRALAALDDTLLLAAAGLTPELRPDPSVLVPLGRALDFYVETVEAGTVRPDDEPPTPDLQALRDAGLSVVSDDEFADAVTGRLPQRRAMLRLLTSDGRDWPTKGDVQTAPR
jgi:hypothetical protein